MDIAGVSALVVGGAGERHRPQGHVEDLAGLLGTGEQPATRCLAADGLHLVPACLREADEQLLGQLGRG